MSYLHRFAFLLLLLLAMAGFSRAEEATHGHVAAHGGCLNEIGGCENGHAEVKIDGQRLRMWLVGGGNNTTASMRIPDASITLTIAPAAGEPQRVVVLAAKPLLLAEETVGDCSYFEASADWLQGITSLKATGSIVFKGKKADLIIEWPHGFDPDHDEPAPAK